jgi:hypothetical protein
VLALSSPQAGAAEDWTMALGSDGAVFQAVTGSYRSLFPNAPASKANNAVLAVDIRRSGQPVTRLLVPGTDDTAVEASPSLVFQNALDTVFLVWESRFNGLHSRLDLASLRNGDWSQPLALRADFWSLKSSPRIAVTTERYQASAGAAPASHERTVIHTVWWEESGDGERTVYSPVVLVDGAYIGWNPVVVLDDLVTAGATAEFAVAENLYRSPNVGRGANRSSLMLSFVDPKTARLQQVEVEVLPTSLTELSAELHNFLLGLDPGSAGNLQSIAEKARAHILIGSVNTFNAKFLLSLANEVQSQILSLAPSAPSLRNIADHARAHILIGSVEISARSLRGEDSRTARVDIYAEEPAAGLSPDGEPVAIVNLRTAASFSAPGIGFGPTTILSSATGDAVLVAWEQNSELRYRENDGSGWSEVRALVLGPGLTRDQAYQVLNKRIQSN